MINKVYQWAKCNESLYVVTGQHEWFANLLLNTVFFYRRAAERSNTRAKNLEHSNRAYKRKLDRLYTICNEYAAYGESCTYEGAEPEEESVLYSD